MYADIYAYTYVRIGMHICVYVICSYVNTYVHRIYIEIQVHLDIFISIHKYSTNISL